jgi:outer membrane protein OmpA-like peptidoglycan-associated protein
MKRYAWVLVVPIVAGLPCASQDQPVGPLKLKILDVVYTIKDIGGKVLDLKVKETDTELRIELAADVLFDFDKADILPKAETVLGQVADLLRRNAKCVMRIQEPTDSKEPPRYN